MVEKCNASGCERLATHKMAMFPAGEFLVCKHHIDEDYQTTRIVDKEQLLQQCDAIREAIEATMYYPVAHGEAERLKQMLEEYEDGSDRKD